MLILNISSRFHIQYTVLAMIQYNTPSTAQWHFKRHFQLVSVSRCHTTIESCTCHTPSPILLMPHNNRRRIFDFSSQSRKKKAETPPPLCHTVNQKKLSNCISTPFEVHPSSPFLKISSPETPLRTDVQNDCGKNSPHPIHLIYSVNNCYTIYNIQYSTFHHRCY